MGGPLSPQTVVRTIVKTAVVTTLPSSHKPHEHHFLTNSIEKISAHSSKLF